MSLVDSAIFAFMIFAGAFAAASIRHDIARAWALLAQLEKERPDDESEAPRDR